MADGSLKILVTGASGFLGSEIVRRLAREEVEVGLLVRPGSDLRRLHGVNTAAFRFIQGDLRELSGCAGALKDFSPGVLVHCAWHGVGNQHRNDAAQVSENLQPTLALLQLAREAGCRRFIGLGSQAEYGPLNRRISESDTTEPTTLYGATKLAAFHLSRQLCAQWGMAHAWLRVFSTYGPREDPSWMIPYLIRSLLKGERPSLTACEQRWDYLFGADAAEAVWALLQKPAVAGVFNLGSGHGGSLRYIVETIRDLIDPSLPLGLGEVPYRPDQVMHLEADITRLTAATGWRPGTELAQGLRQTVAWHRAVTTPPAP